MEVTSEENGVRILENAESAVKHSENVVIAESATEKLFVYGIFLDELNRTHYGMENPSYDTVKGFITVGNHIVRAVKVGVPDVALTGLLVDVPTRKLPAVDALEAGYARIKVHTTGGFDAFMYATPSGEENYSNIRSNFYEQSEELDTAL